MKTVRLPDGGFPFSSLGASPDLSLACIQFGPFYECAVFGEIIVHRMGYFKRTRASDEQLATDPHRHWSIFTAETAKYAEKTAIETTKNTKSTK